MDGLSRPAIESSIYAISDIVQACFGLRALSARDSSPGEGGPVGLRAQPALGRRREIADRLASPIPGIRLGEKVLVAEGASLTRMLWCSAGARRRHECFVLFYEETNAARKVRS